MELVFEVGYGLNDEGDYVCHFSSFHKARPFPNNPHLFLRILKTYMSPVVPTDVTVDVHLPPSAWEKKVISVLCKGLGKKWNFDEERVVKAVNDTANHMTDELNRLHPRRTSL